jgi:hypothetical protein
MVAIIDEEGCLPLFNFDLNSTEIFIAVHNFYTTTPKQFLPKTGCTAKDPPPDTTADDSTASA